MTKKGKKRVFSGIQPTGNLHLGNYLGAIKNWVKHQKDYDNIYCVVNSHAITIYQDPQILADKTREMFAWLLACGLDSKHCKVFIQSRIDYHPALAWLLECNISMGDMSRMTQFKDKSKKNPKNINVGLFNYPALMAADILLYQSELVPVGEDQRQHLELTRDVAMRFNERYGECFTIPKAMIAQVGAKIMSLDNPQSKMSKSSSSENGIIYLLDSKDSVVKKLKRATTDSFSEIRFYDTPERAGIFNLLSIYESLSGLSRNSIEKDFEGKGYGEFKLAVAEVINDALEPLQSEFKRLMNDKAYIEEQMSAHEGSVREIARSTYEKAKMLIGLI